MCISSKIPGHSAEDALPEASEVIDAFDDSDGELGGWGHLQQTMTLSTLLISGNKVETSAVGWFVDQDAFDGMDAVVDTSWPPMTLT
ncbi:hypothetical protein THAOC_03098 [Thalassiosira oceanica]|uniref:Uncharacterized protein n=1 Tax=Thalassiosira oceanica TaxID=159749 RepID=K0TDM8_THAOC|nr:hypothetical protein THAOC_03098 [Thalassiosira oceanica]|eukprot:EJK75189.1 hypothetical protein THAOC_03098 [Thalassiosira oceanica]